MNDIPVSLSDLDDEILPDSADQDFRSTFQLSESIYPGAKPMSPFCAFRRAVAQAMGMRWGSLTQSDITELKDDGGKTLQVTYPGLPRDVTIVAWLCSISEEEVLRADAHPRKAVAEAFAWANKNKLVFPSPAFLRAQAIVSGFFSDESAATSQPAEAGEGSKKNN